MNPIELIAQDASQILAQSKATMLLVTRDRLALYFHEYTLVWAASLPETLNSISEHPQQPGTFLVENGKERWLLDRGFLFPVEQERHEERRDQMRLSYLNELIALRTTLLSRIRVDDSLMQVCLTRDGLTCKASEAVDLVLVHQYTQEPYSYRVLHSTKSEFTLQIEPKRSGYCLVQFSLTQETTCVPF